MLESVTVRAAVSLVAATAFGVKTTETVQPARGASKVQVLVAVKSAALVPVMVATTAPVATSPELATPNVIAELGTPTAVANACAELGLITSFAGFWAVAVTGMVTVLPLIPPALITIESVFSPALVAVKFTATVQDAPAARAAVQVLAALSMATSGPLEVTARSVRAVDAVTVIVCFGAAVPTGIAPSAIVEGITEN